MNAVHPERERKIQMLFEAAVDLDPDEQARFLDQACAGDGRLRRDLEAILAAARGSTDRRLKQLLDSDQVQQDTVVMRPKAAVPDRGNNRDAGAEADMKLPAPGTSIGPYELIRELGRGGMGAVYLARDTKLGRRVAVKFLQSDQPTLTERFIVEAQATARCSHENIIVIHDVKEYRGNPYMVLEYLKGQPLGKLLASGPLPPYRAVQLVVPVVKALVCAHEHKIVHRDLKPDNIFITRSGAIKVLDFGIAKCFFGDQQRSLIEQVSTTVDNTVTELPVQPELTRHGALVGTMPYMSPEQWGVDTVDHRTDLWATGILLYRMITGKHPLAPLRGQQLVVTAVLDQPMPSARNAGVDMPLELADLIDHCLKKRKEERIPNAKALLDALEQLLPDQRGRTLTMGESPYAGLTPFQESDANRFFGRSREIATVLARLHERPLVGIVGPSGAGKSSFVRAGLIPELKHSGEAWEALVIRPGRSPMAALANVLVPMLTDESSTLSEQVAQHQEVLHRLHEEPGYLGTVLRGRARKSKRKFLLFVDQFEELFTLTPDAHERLAFTACLAGMADDALSPLRVALSIRSDFLDRVAEDRGFMTELSLFFLLPPDRESLREALTRPAEMVRYRFETRAMVEHMLDELHTTPGALPLLQFAATKLWDARNTKRRLLTERSYRDIGGIAGALASHADAVLGALPPRSQGLVRAIFLQLVTRERTRAIASLADLRELTDDPDGADEIINHLVDARLLVVQRSDSAMGATVEIVHEALIRAWPTLNHWLDENQEDLIFLQQLRTAARQWDEHGQRPGLLWRGDMARDARQWYRRYGGSLPPLHEKFLFAVFALAERTARIKRLAIIGTIGLLSLLVAAAAVALVLIRDAERQAQEQALAARAAEREAQEQALAARAAEREVRAKAATIAHNQREILALLEQNQSLDGETARLREKLQGTIKELARVDRAPRRARRETAVRESPASGREAGADERVARPAPETEVALPLAAQDEATSSQREDATEAQRGIDESEEDAGAAHQRVEQLEQALARAQRDAHATKEQLARAQSEAESTKERLAHVEREVESTKKLLSEARRDAEAAERRAREWRKKVSRAMNKGFARDTAACRKPIDDLTTADDVRTTDSD